MQRDFGPRRQLLFVAALLTSLLGASVSADDWLVYLGGGMEPIEGGWDYHEGRVTFRKLGGTLVSTPFADVDLPTSAFITWQLNGRRETPPRSPIPASSEDGASADGRVEVRCAKALVVSLIDGETIEVEGETRTEIVHVACFDAPDIRHRFPELSWFGRVTRTSIGHALKTGAEVCLAELAMPQRDQDGHRIVYVTLASGKDYAAEAIRGGLGLLRPGPCERAEAYRRLEDRAIAEERGLWGERSEEVAFAVAANTVAIGAGGVGTPPPRRVGGG